MNDNEKKSIRTLFKLTNNDDKKLFNNLIKYLSYNDAIFILNDNYFKTNKNYHLMLIKSLSIGKDVFNYYKYHLNNGARETLINISLSYLINNKNNFNIIKRVIDLEHPFSNYYAEYILKVFIPDIPMNILNLTLKYDLFKILRFKDLNNFYYICLKNNDDLEYIEKYIKNEILPNISYKKLVLCASNKNILPYIKLK